MAADLIPLHSDRHQQAQELLPWYCTGKLDAGDRARVDAHLAECAACQAELRLEARLGEAIAALPLELELGWSDLRQRLQLRPSVWQRFRRSLTDLWHALESGDYARWAVAAQMGFVLLLVSLVSLNSAPDRTVEYHTLGTASAVPAGNLIVMFKPDTAEGELRRLVAGAGARLVDGPTPAGAYVLYVPTDRRPAALANLRSEGAILMAEPLDESLSR